MCAFFISLNCSAKKQFREFRLHRKFITTISQRYECTNEMWRYREGKNNADEKMRKTWLMNCGWELNIFFRSSDCSVAAHRIESSSKRIRVRCSFLKAQKNNKRRSRKVSRLVIGKQQNNHDLTARNAMKTTTKSDETRWRTIRTIDEQEKMKNIQTNSVKQTKERRAFILRLSWFLFLFFI